MFLTIVFTKNKIHTLLKRSHDSTVLKYAKLTDDIGFCFNASMKQANAKGWKIKKPIPTAIILPFDATIWTKKIKDFLKKYENDIQIVFKENLALAYLKGVGKPIQKSDYIILHNDNKSSELFFYKSEGTSQLLLIPDMHIENGQQDLVDHIVQVFSNQGFSLDKNLKKQIFQQVQNGKKEGSYTINKKNNVIDITASVHVSAKECEDKMSTNRTLLSKYLSPQVLSSSPNLKELILVGDYFDNQTVQDYLTDELKLTTYLTKNSHTNLETIVEKASIVGFKGVEDYLAVQLVENERITQLKMKRSAKLARESLLLEIREVCTDYTKAEQYKKTFAKKADDLGIPREVIIWNIDEIIDTLELDEELKKKSSLPPISSMSNVKVTAAQSITNHQVEDDSLIRPKVGNPSTGLSAEIAATKAKSPVSVKQVKTDDLTRKNFTKQTAANAQKVNSIKSISNLFKTKRELPEIGFHAQIGALINQPDTEQLIRHISNSEAKVKVVMASFEKLHLKESMYYENVSPIHQASFGKYYFRESLEGETLTNYIKKNTGRFKSNIEKWSSADLKLILKIWKEINNLDYSYPIKADDIIILSKLTWSLKRETEIKLVNFNANEISKKQMEDKMHQALLELFGKKIYQNLRNKFSI